jgi:hypothetical protein
MVNNSASFFDFILLFVCVLMNIFYVIDVENGEILLVGIISAVILTDLASKALAKRRYRGLRNLIYFKTCLLILLSPNSGIQQFLARNDPPAFSLAVNHGIGALSNYNNRDFLQHDGIIPQVCQPLEMWGMDSEHNEKLAEKEKFKKIEIEKLESADLNAPKHEDQVNSQRQYTWRRFGIKSVFVIGGGVAIYYGLWNPAITNFPKDFRGVVNAILWKNS